MERFKKALRSCVTQTKFDLGKAEELCVRIHKAELEGYEPSRSEDRLHLCLIEKIQKRYYPLNQKS